MRGDGFRAVNVVATRLRGHAESAGVERALTSQWLQRSAFHWPVKVNNLTVYVRRSWLIVAGSIS